MRPPRALSPRESMEAKGVVTKMKRCATAKQIVLGLVLGLLANPPQLVQAQWTVYDPANHATQIERMIQDAARWIETINHYAQEIQKYQNMIENQVKQITSLGGILKTVDEQLARHKRLVGTIARLGDTVRSVFQLKDQLLRMVTCRIRAVQNVWRRLENGVFDSEQNGRDLEDYLRFTIGRSASERISHTEVLARQDVQFSELHYQRELAYVRLAKLREKMLDIQAKLIEETSKPDGDQQAVDQLNQQMAACELAYEELVKTISDLSQKIAEKNAKYGVLLEKHINFARVVEKDLAWFENMARLNDEVTDALERAFDPNTEAEIDPVPDGFTIPFTVNRQPPTLSGH